MKRILFLILFFLNYQNVYAQEFSVFNELNFFKTGEYLYEFGFFKLNVYKVHFYCKSRECSKKDIKNANGTFYIKFEYLRDVKKKYSVKGWTVGLKRNLGSKYLEFKNEIGWLKQNTFEIKKNDVVVIGVDEGEVTFYKNNEIMANTQNLKLTKIIFLPWIGKKPITKNCIKNLFKFAK